MFLHFVREAPAPPAVDRWARRAVRLILGREGVRGKWSLWVIWTSRQRLRALNQRFRGVDRFTDVIAFSYRGQNGRRRKSGGLRWPLPRDSGPPLLGDLFIAVAQARLSARRFGVPFRQELLRLVVHGTLHLLGYSDYTRRAKKKMWGVQEKVLRRVFGPFREKTNSLPASSSKRSFARRQ